MLTRHTVIYLCVGQVHLFVSHPLIHRFCDHSWWPKGLTQTVAYQAQMTTDAVWCQSILQIPSPSYWHRTDDHRCCMMSKHSTDSITFILAHFLPSAYTYWSSMMLRFLWHALESGSIYVHILSMRFNNQQAIFTSQHLDPPVSSNWSQANWQTSYNLPTCANSSFLEPKSDSNCASCPLFSFLFSFLLSVSPPTSCWTFAVWCCGRVLQQNMWMFD